VSDAKNITVIPARRNLHTGIPRSASEKRRVAGYANGQIVVRFSISAQMTESMLPIATTKPNITKKVGTAPHLGFYSNIKKKYQT